MNKTSIAIVLAVVLIAAGALYFTRGGKGDSMMQANTESKSMGSIKDLMARGSSECTVSNKVANSESSGTVYVGNGKMRGDFKSVTVNPAMTIESHMISDGEYIYSWSSAMPQGVKMAVAATQSGQPTGQNQQDFYNSQVDYDCNSWRVDESKFEVPSDVTFMDMSSMMNAGAQTGAPNNGSMNPPSKSNQCNMCDGAPEPQRTQCREALNCR